VGEGRVGEWRVGEWRVGEWASGRVGECQVSWGVALEILFVF
jgi:hypothetical protein